MGMTIVTLAIEMVECAKSNITQNIYNALGLLSSGMRQRGCGRPALMRECRAGYEAMKSPNPHSQTVEQWSSEAAE